MTATPALRAFRTAAQQVVIGEGAAASLAEHLGALGSRSVGIIASSRALGSALGARTLDAARSHAGGSVAVWSDVPAHTPLPTVAAAADALAAAGVDAVVAIGGGSASDLAKGVAARLVVGDQLASHFIRRRPDGTVEDRPLPPGAPPVIAVPTTLSAAEITWGAGITDGGMKHVLWDPALASRVVLYDTADDVELPATVVASTGMNAVAHCVEATYSKAGGPMSDGLAEAGLDRLAEGLVRYLAAGERTPAVRTLLFAGAALSGQALANARICLHHALAHVLGASHHVGHGDLNAVLLSHVADLNRPASATAQARCAAIVRAAAARAGHGVDEEDLGPALRRLAALIDAPTTLVEVGVADLDVDRTWRALEVERGLAFNPVPVGREELVHVLAAAGAPIARGAPARR